MPGSSPAVAITSSQLGMAGSLRRYDAGARSGTAASRGSDPGDGGDPERRHGGGRVGPPRGAVVPGCLLATLSDHSSSLGTFKTPPPPPPQLTSAQREPPRSPQAST